MTRCLLLSNIAPIIDGESLAASAAETVQTLASRGSTTISVSSLSLQIERFRLALAMSRAITALGVLRSTCAGFTSPRHDGEQLNVLRLQRASNGCKLTYPDFLVRAVLDVIQGDSWPRSGVFGCRAIYARSNASRLTQIKRQGNGGPDCPCCSCGIFTLVVASSRLIYKDLTKFNNLASQTWCLTWSGGRTIPAFICSTKRPLPGHSRLRCRR